MPSGPGAVDDLGEVVAVGNPCIRIGVFSNGALAVDVLFAALLGNLHDGRSFRASLQAR